MVVALEELGVLLPKLVGEDVFVDFDFAPLFNTGIAISSAGPVVVTRCGGNADATPSNMLSGGNSVQAGVLSQKFTAGVADTNYLLTATANGDDGSKQQIQLILPVVSKRLG